MCTSTHIVIYLSRLCRDIYLVQLFLCFHHFHKLLFFHLVPNQFIQVEGYRFNLNQHECFLCHSFQDVVPLAFLYSGRENGTSNSKQHLMVLSAA